MSEKQEKKCRQFDVLFCTRTKVRIIAMITLLLSAVWFNILSEDKKGGRDVLNTLINITSPHNAVFVVLFFQKKIFSQSSLFY